MRIELFLNFYLGLTRIGLRLLSGPNLEDYSYTKVLRVSDFVRSGRVQRVNRVGYGGFKLLQLQEVRPDFISV